MKLFNLYLPTYMNVNELFKDLGKPWSILYEHVQNHEYAGKKGYEDFIRDVANDVSLRELFYRDYRQLQFNLSDFKVKNMRGSKNKTISSLCADYTLIAIVLGRYLREYNKGVEGFDHFINVGLPIHPTEEDKKRIYKSIKNIEKFIAQVYKAMNA